VSGENDTRVPAAPDHARNRGTRSSLRCAPSGLRVLAVLPQLIPSTTMGVVKPLAALHRAGAIAFDVALESWVSRARIARADVVVFCRNTEPRFGAALDTALALGKRIVYDLDDDLFAMPPDVPGSAYHGDPARRAQLRRYVETASLVRVYSDGLRARVEPLNPRVRRAPGLIDWHLVASPTPRPTGPLRIVYATSRTTDYLAAMFVDDLARVLDAFRGRVEAWFCGYRPRGLAGRADVHAVEFIRDYDQYTRWFSGSGFDIGLAPLRDDAFHRAKADTKFRDYAASRVAGLYSDVSVYRECVVPGETGLLVPPVDGAWRAALTRLIEDAALRARIQREAWTAARRRYGLAQSAASWLADLAAAEPARGLPPGARAAAAPLVDALARGARLVRRGAEALGGRAPGAVTLGARLRWHVGSARALVRLRRELARAKAAPG